MRRGLAREVEILKILVNQVRLGQLDFSVSQSFYVDSDLILQGALVLDVKCFDDIPNCLIDVPGTWICEDPFVDIDDEDHVELLEERFVYP